jgi:hypothetical protein
LSQPWRIGLNIREISSRDLSLRLWMFQDLMVFRTILAAFPLIAGLKVTKNFP